MNQTGELKQVADGYARNYLFPHKLATAATAEAVQASEVQRAKRVAEQVANKDAATEVAKKLKGVDVQIAAKANETGTLFAAVSAADVVAAVKKNIGLTLAPEAIALESIKKIGKYVVIATLPQVEPVSFNVMIISDNA